MALFNSEIQPDNYTHVLKAIPVVLYYRWLTLPFLRIHIGMRAWDEFERIWESSQKQALAFPFWCGLGERMTSASMLGHGTRSVSHLNAHTTLYVSANSPVSLDSF